MKRLQSPGGLGRLLLFSGLLVGATYFGVTSCDAYASKNSQPQPKVVTQNCCDSVPDVTQNGALNIYAKDSAEVHLSDVVVHYHTHIHTSKNTSSRGSIFPNNAGGNSNSNNNSSGTSSSSGNTSSRQSSVDDAVNTANASSPQKPVLDLNSDTTGYDLGMGRNSCRRSYQ